MWLLGSPASPPLLRDYYSAVDKRWRHMLAQRHKGRSKASGPSSWLERLVRGGDALRKVGGRRGGASNTTVVDYGGRV